ncbi:hypothetical protein GCM10020370_18390 [Paenibacillus hodogayensis]
MFGIVDINVLQTIKSQAFETFFHGTFDLFTAEVAGHQVAVGFGGQHVVRRKSAIRLNGLADPPLALT